MNESKHTPGPWTHSNLVVRAGRSQKHPMGRQIADCYRELPAGHFDEGENAANAQLIAAAPDMSELIMKLQTNISLTPELNMSNYTEEEVETLNHSMNMLSGLIDEYFAKHPKAQGAPA